MGTSCAAAPAAARKSKVPDVASVLSAVVMRRWLMRESPSCDAADDRSSRNPVECPLLKPPAPPRIPHMRTLALALIASVAIVSPAFAQAADPAVLAPINGFLEAFNKGDVAGAAATHVSDASLVIVDEAAPYIWHGAKAVQAWATDLSASDTKAGVTDQKVVLGAPTRVEVAGTAAYVIAPAVYTFKEKVAVK